jgi:PAS domain S-box-containing protein
MARVLVVDDEKSIRITLGKFIEEGGHEVHTAEDVERALAKIQDMQFDVIVTDIIMPRIDGVDLLRKLHETSPNIQVVMITGEPTIDTAAEAVRAGAFDYIPKPISGDAIKKVVSRAAEVKRLQDEKRLLEEENIRHQEHLEELVTEKTKELRESEERYRSLFEDSLNAIYVSDIAGRIVDVNPAARELFGYTEEEMKGMDVSKLYVKMSDRDRFEMEIATNGFVRNYGIRFYRKDGEAIDCLVSSTVRRDKSGEIIGYQGIIKDISEQKRTETLMKEEAEKRKQIVVNITHLLMTPLTIVKGNLELILRGKKEFSEDLIRALTKEVDGLEHLIHGELFVNIESMTVPTYDGFTPVDRIDCDE